MNFPVIQLTPVRELVVMITDQIGTFHFTNQYFVVEMNQVTNQAIDIDGPYSTIKQALDAAKLIATEIAQSEISSAEGTTF